MKSYKGTKLPQPHISPGNIFIVESLEQFVKFVVRLYFTFCWLNTLSCIIVTVIAIVHLLYWNFASRCISFQVPVMIIIDCLLDRCTCTCREGVFRAQKGCGYWCQEYLNLSVVCPKGQAIRLDKNNEIWISWENLKRENFTSVRTWTFWRSYIHRDDGYILLRRWLNSSSWQRQRCGRTSWPFMSTCFTPGTFVLTALYYHWNVENMKPIAYSL